MWALCLTTWSLRWKWASSENMILSKKVPLSASRWSMSSQNVSRSIKSSSLSFCKTRILKGWCCRFWRRMCWMIDLDRSRATLARRWEVPGSAVKWSNTMPTLSIVLEDVGRPNAACPRLLHFRSDWRELTWQLWTGSFTFFPNLFRNLRWTITTITLKLCSNEKALLISVALCHPKIWW